MGFQSWLCSEEMDDAHSKGYYKGEKEGYSEGYSEGKSNGYSEGYSEGKTEGYSDGKKEGYNDGYDSGTSAFVKDSYMPSFGLIIILFISFIIAYFIYRFTKDPIKRNVDRKINLTEREREIKILREKVLAQKENDTDVQKIKAKKLALGLFEGAEDLIAHARSEQIINNAKNDLEIQISKILLDSTNRVYEEKNSLIDEIEKLPEILSDEKESLLKTIPYQ